MRVYANTFMALVAFVIAGLVCSVSTAAGEPAEAKSGDYVQAYYFHATRRCATCMKLEQYSRAAIESNFKDQLKNGTLRFEEVNFDEPENRHFLQDYNLMYRALVLVHYKDGKQIGYRNLDKIWQLIGDKEAFMDYVKTETEAYLKEL